MLREAFHVFVSEVFGGDIGFREWEAAGFWTDRYRPYSILEGQRVIANASVCTVQLFLSGDSEKGNTEQTVPGLQFATVGTVPDRRGEGHAARLMRHILGEHGIPADPRGMEPLSAAGNPMAQPLAFLYANVDVLDFYPRFGFQPFCEQLFRSAVDWSASDHSIKIQRLRLDTDAGMQEFRTRIATRAPHTARFGAADYDHILAFHAMHFFTDSLLLVPFIAEQAGDSSDMLLIATREDDALQVYDVVCDALPTPAEFRRALQLAAAACFADDPDRNHCDVIYHFTPELLDPDAKPFETGFESPLFVHATALAGFPDHAPVKFPALAQT